LIFVEGRKLDSIDMLSKTFALDPDHTRGQAQDVILFFRMNRNNKLVSDFQYWPTFTLDTQSRGREIKNGTDAGLCTVTAQATMTPAFIRGLMAGVHPESAIAGHSHTLDIGKGRGLGHELIASQPLSHRMVRVISVAQGYRPIINAFLRVMKI